MPSSKMKKKVIPQCFEESPSVLGIINYTAQLPSIGCYAVLED